MSLAEGIIYCNMAAELSVNNYFFFFSPLLFFFFFFVRIILHTYWDIHVLGVEGLLPSWVKVAEQLAGIDWVCGKAKQSKPPVTDLR